MAQRFSLLQAAQATGLEECEILFFEQVFREFLTSPQPALGRMEFSQDHLDILRRVKRLIHEDGRSLDEVRRELRGAMSASRAEAPFAFASSPYLAQVPRRARVIAVTGGRSGVGKTFITVNLALAYAAAGLRVAIYDQDLELSGVQHLLGLSPRSQMLASDPAALTLDDLLTRGPFGIRVLSGAHGLRQLAGLAASERRAVLSQLDQLEREVDLLLIDTGAGIGGDILRLASSADQLLVVTTPHFAASADSYSLLKVLFEANPELQPGLVVNMVQTAWQGHGVFSRLHQALQKYLRRDLDDMGSIVFDPHVTVACQLRRPLLMEYPQCEAFQCIRALAETLHPHGEDAALEGADAAFDDLMGALRRAVVGV